MTTKVTTACLRPGAVVGAGGVAVDEEVVGGAAVGAVGREEGEAAHQVAVCLRTSHTTRPRHLLRLHRPQGRPRPRLPPWLTRRHHQHRRHRRRRRRASMGPRLLGAPSAPGFASSTADVCLSLSRFENRRRRCPGCGTPGLCVPRDTLQSVTIG